MTTPADARRALPVVALLAGPTLALTAYLLLGLAEPGALPETARRTAGVLVWMAVWWLTEAIPLAATALLPIPLFPLLGVTTVGAACAPFADKVIFLFMGGFMIALAMEKSGLHRRIALLTVNLIGTRPSLLVAGFMLATAFLSMWMSNTATAVMMFPIGLSIITLVRERAGPQFVNFGVCLMLGIAYAASIGGVATPIGTPPNAILLAFLRERYDFEINFRQWMVMGLPVVALMLPLTWLLLTRVVYPIRLPEIPGGRELIRDELRRLGRISRAEWTVLGVFGFAVACWILRDAAAALLPALAPVIRRADDSVVAVAAAILLFVIPTNLARREFALDWKTAERLPWGVLLLFGGGLSLAGGVRASGLDAFIGAQFAVFHGLHPVLIVLALVAALIFLTEVTSNTATATIFFPVLAGMAPALGINPMLVLLPVCIGVSCAFMLPMATPPNALVFGTGYVTIRQMAKAGFWLNLISIGVVTLLTFTVFSWTALPRFADHAAP